MRRGVRSHGGPNEDGCSGTINGDVRHLWSTQRPRMAQQVPEVDPKARQGTRAVSLARLKIEGHGDDRLVHEDRRRRMDHMQIVYLFLPRSDSLSIALSETLSISFSRCLSLALYLHRPLSHCLGCLVHVDVTRYGEGRGVLSVARPEIP